MMELWIFQSHPFFIGKLAAIYFQGGVYTPPKTNACPLKEMDVSKNSWFSPQIIHFNRVFHYKPSILGYPYFWKPPNSAWLDDDLPVEVASPSPFFWGGTNSSRAGEPQDSRLVLWTHGNRGWKWWEIGHIFLSASREVPQVDQFLRKEIGHGEFHHPKNHGSNPCEKEGFGCVFLRGFGDLKTTSDLRSHDDS